MVSLTLAKMWQSRTLFASLKGSHSDAKWDISSELNLNGKIIKVTDVGNELKLNVSSAAIYPSFANALFNKFSFAKAKLKLTVMKDEESGGFGLLFQEPPLWIRNRLKEVRLSAL